MTHPKNNEYQKKWRAANREKHNAIMLPRVRQRREELRKWFQELKETFSCSRCGENHPACLDFHHTDPDKKEIIVSRCVAVGWGKKRILAEIDKCDVLCANCHRKEHATVAHGEQPDL